MTDQAAIARKALLASLLQKIHGKKPLTAAEYKQLQDLTATEKTESPAPAWTGQREAAQELGLTVAQLRKYQRAGCPLEPGPAGIDKCTALLWLWNNRNNETEEALKAERLRLGNQRLAGSHLAAASALALRILQTAKDGFRHRLTSRRLAELRQTDDKQTVAALGDMLSAAVDTALNKGNA